MNGQTNIFFPPWDHPLSGPLPKIETANYNEIKLQTSGMESKIILANFSSFSKIYLLSHIIYYVSSAKSARIKQFQSVSFAGFYTF